MGTALIGDGTGDWGEHEKDCPPDLLAIAETLGIKPEPVKPTLSAIAADKAKGAAKAKPAAKKKAATSGKGKGTVRAAILPKTAKRSPARASKARAK